MQWHTRSVSVYSRASTSQGGDAINDIEVIEAMSKRSPDKATAWKRRIQV